VNMSSPSSRPRIIQACAAARIVSTTTGTAPEIFPASSVSFFAYQDIALRRWWRTHLPRGATLVGWDDHKYVHSSLPLCTPLQICLSD
jgi:hypothetical protein